jgi:hypothetical protein
MSSRLVQVLATLTTDSTPLQGKTIQFRHKKSTDITWTDDGTDVTDENGQCTKDLQLAVPETYDFNIIFAGDSDYEPAEASELNHRVKATVSLGITVTP